MVCSIIILASWFAFSSWCTLERRRARGTTRVADRFSTSFESAGICQTEAQVCGLRHVAMALDDRPARSTLGVEGCFAATAAGFGKDFVAQPDRNLVRERHHWKRSGCTGLGLSVGVPRTAGTRGAWGGRGRNRRPLRGDATRSSPYLTAVRAGDCVNAAPPTAGDQVFSTLPSKLPGVSNGRSASSASSQRTVRTFSQFQLSRRRASANSSRR